MRVHRNLNKACWSLSRKGEPVEHVDCFALVTVRFVVSEAGRARVLAEGVRAVHAWAEGGEVSPTLVNEGWEFAETGDWVEICYNPYRGGTFTTRDGEPVERAALVAFTASGKCWAILSCWGTDPTAY